MMTIDEIWVKAADDALKNNGIVFDNSYLKCYRGYISTFGTAIVQSGLVAASVFYELNEKKSKGNRYAVITAVIDMLIQLGKIPTIPKKERRLSNYALTHQQERHRLVMWVDKSIAYLKFALRQYKEIEEQSTRTKGMDSSFENHLEAPKIFGEETDVVLSQQQFTKFMSEYNDVSINNYVGANNNMNSKNNAREKDDATANIGWLFYRHFYKDFTYHKNTVYIEKNGRRGQKQGTEQELKFKKRTRQICTSLLKKEYRQQNLALLSALPGEEFKLQTSYPGLLIGSGLNHSSGENFDVKMGFLFDYTTGLPYIPGSSIKGVLRSMFPMKKNNSKKENTRQFIEERIEYLNSILNKKYEEEQLQLLGLDIFEKDINEGKDEGYKRDIFFDALITQSGNDCSYIIGDDYITPHENPLKNPNPIQFIKVLPKVVFTFKFCLHDTCLSDGTRFTVAQKLKLFKQILKDVGVGAKTNVGYGNLCEC